MLLMGNRTLLWRRIQDTGLSFLFLPPPSGSTDPVGLQWQCILWTLGLPMSRSGDKHMLCSTVLMGEKSFSLPGNGVMWPLCSHLPGPRVCSDVVGLLPRDLKRDVAKKLEKLEKRTQRAIAELIRESQCCRDGVGRRWLFWRDLHGPYWELGAFLLDQVGTGGA